MVPSQEAMNHRESELDGKVRKVAQKTYPAPSEATAGDDEGCKPYDGYHERAKLSFLMGL